MADTVDVANSAPKGIVYKVNPFNLKKNESYLVRLVSSDQKAAGNSYIDIENYIDKNINIKSSATYEQPVKTFIDAFSDLVDSKTVKGTTALTKITGEKTLMDQYSAFPMWQRNEPLSLMIDFEFYAYSDTMRDVMIPTIGLLKLVSPSCENGNTIIGPGPRFIRKNANEAGNGDGFGLDTSRTLTLYIGKYLRIDNIIVKTADATFSNTFDVNGLPTSSKVSCEMQSSLPPTKEDIDNWFQPKNNYDQLSRFDLSNFSKSVVNQVVNSFNTTVALGAEISRKTGLSDAIKSVKDTVENAFTGGGSQQKAENDAKENVGGNADKMMKDMSNAKNQGGVSGGR